MREWTITKVITVLTVARNSIPSLSLESPNFRQMCSLVTSVSFLKLPRLHRIPIERPCRRYARKPPWHTIGGAWLFPPAIEVFAHVDAHEAICRDLGLRRCGGAIPLLATLAIG